MMLTFALLTSLAYLISVFLLHRADKPKLNAILVSMVGAIIMHLIQVLHGLQGALNDVSVVNMLSLIAVCMAVIGGLRYFIRGDRSAYIVVGFIAAVSVWFPTLLPVSRLLITDSGLKFHIVLSIAAYIALSFSALYACFLLYQDAQLKKGGAATFHLSLPLNYIERTMLSFTLFGEVLLTLSLATGLLFIHDFWAQHISHKVVFGFIAWLVIAVLLVRHYRQGFRGRQAALWLLSGFVFLLLAYFGSAIILQIVLHR